VRKFLGVLCTSVIVLTGCGSNSGSNNTDSGFVSGNGSIVLVASDKRGDVVALSGKTLDGANLDIAQWRDDVVVVNLWASWCGPCRAEAVNLEKVNKQFASKGVHFVGLNTRDGLASARAFNKRFNTGYPSIQDQDGTLTLAFGNLGPAATPSTLVLDRQGRVAVRILGPVTEAQLRDVVAAVVSEK